MTRRSTKTIGYAALAMVMAANMGLTSFAASTTAGISSVSTGTAQTSTPFAGMSSAMNKLIVAAGDKAGKVEITDNEAEAVAESIYANIAIAQVDNYVYIRSEASSDSEYVGKLYNNSAATITESVEAEDGTWLLITSGDCSGYVKEEYLVQNDEELAKKVSTRYAKSTTETLYVREQPTTDSAVIDMIPLGDDYVVIDESMADTGWVMITCEAGEGYVSTEFVELSTEFTRAESKAAEEARLAREKAEKEAAIEAAKKATAAAAASSKSDKNSSSSSSSSKKSYSGPSGSGGSAVVSYGSQFVGNPYVYGGSSLTNGTDCSGFVMSVYAAFGVSLPHSSSALRSVGSAVSYDDMQPGDIVCYSGHVGIYAGNGTLLHASNKRTGITYSNVNYKNILAIRRIF